MECLAQGRGIQAVKVYAIAAGAGTVTVTYTVWGAGAVEESTMWPWELVSTGFVESIVEGFRDGATILCKGVEIREQKGGRLPLEPLILIMKALP